MVTRFNSIVLLFSRVVGVAGYGALVGPTWLAPLAVAVISCTLNPTVREFGQISAGCVAGVTISAVFNAPVAYSMGVGFVGAALVGLTATALVDPTPPHTSYVPLAPEVNCNDPPTHSTPVIRRVPKVAEDTYEGLLY